MAKSKEQPPRNPIATSDESPVEVRAGKQFPAKKRTKGARAAKSPEELPKGIDVAETVAAETGPFDTDAFVRDVEKKYLRLGESIRRKGVDPRELSDGVWESANRAFENMQELSDQYRKEADPGKRSDISARIQRLGVRLGGGIKRDLEAATGKFLGERAGARPAARSAHVPGAVAEAGSAKQPEAGASSKQASENAGIKPEETFEDVRPNRAAAPRTLAEELIERDQDLDRRLLIRRAEKAAQKRGPVSAAVERAEPENDRKREIRERLAELERQAKKFSDQSHGEIEREFLALEEELRALESVGLPASKTSSEEVPVSEPDGPHEISEQTEAAELLKKMRERAGAESQTAAEEAKVPEREVSSSDDTLTPEQFAAVFTSNRPRAEESSSQPIPSSDRSPDAEEPAVEMPLRTRMEEALDREDWQEHFAEPKTDQTPAEWRDELRGIVGELEKLERKFGITPAGENLQTYVESRSRELTVYAEKEGQAVKRITDHVGKAYGRLGSAARFSVGSKFLKKIATLTLVGALAALISNTVDNEQSPSQATRAFTPSSSEIPSSGVAPAVPAEAAVSMPAAAAGGSAAIAHASEMPTVGASPRGYEGMLKEVWSKVHEPGFLAPTHLDPGSDLARLLAARDEQAFNAVAHDLIGTHGHHFLREDGTSVRIDADAHMTVGSHGEIRVQQGGRDFADAPEYAPVTPTLVPPQAETVMTPEVAKIDITGTQPPAPVETAVPHPVAGSESASSASAPEPVPQTTMIEHSEKFTNVNNLPIDPLHGHVFQTSDGSVVAYGNDFSSRFDAAETFAKADPGTSVWVQAEKPVFYDGAWRPWLLEVKYGGWWRGIHVSNGDGPSDPSQIGAVNPDTFIKQLDR